MTGASLNLLVIQASDIEQSRRFYEKLGLAFISEQHGSGPEHFACQIGNAVFEIYPRKNGKVDATTRLGFSVPSVDEAISRLKSLGATIVREAKESPWGRRAIVDDPDGYRVEISEAAST